MNRNILLSLLVLAGIWYTSATSLAHVLLTDTTGRVGAVLHINPDDDPVAGEPSTLFFDIQNSTFSSHAHEFKLSITGPTDQTDIVPVVVNGSSGSSTYVFPSQGAYTLAYIAGSDGHTHTFIHTQRVSRGFTDSPLTQPIYEWAEFLLIVAGTALTLLMITFINRKRAIKVYSKW